MGKLIVSENVTLDGVVRAETTEEGFPRGGWFLQVSDADRAAWAAFFHGEALAAEALLLGRRSDEYFASRWLTRTGDWADRLNGMPKYVVSSTLREARWSNATVLAGDVVKEVTTLKQELAGDVVVYGSTQLVRTLLEHDLVDELRLVVFPVVLGDGERLFGETTATRPQRLISTRVLGDGLACLTYQRVSRRPA